MHRAYAWRPKGILIAELNPKEGHGMDIITSLSRHLRKGMEARFAATSLLRSVAQGSFDVYDYVLYCASMGEMLA